MTALIVSMSVHAGFILVKLPSLPVFQQKKQVKVQIAYLKDVNKLHRGYSQAEGPKKSIAALTNRPRTRSVSLPVLDKERLLRSDRPAAQPDLLKPAMPKPDVTGFKKKITLPPIDTDKIDNPSYLNYYQIVREKIRRCAYENYSRSETGEVYLAFVVSSQGMLREVKLIEEKSTENAYLRGISVRSINDASPFPAFPTELDYPQLSFNVMISFEIQ